MGYGDYMVTMHNTNYTGVKVRGVGEVWLSGPVDWAGVCYVGYPPKHRCEFFVLCGLVVHTEV